MHSGTDRHSDDEGSGEDSEGSSLSGSEEHSQSGSGSESDSGIDHLLFEFCMSICLCLLKRLLTRVTAYTAPPTSALVVEHGNMVNLSAFVSACCYLHKSYRPFKY